MTKQILIELFCMWCVKCNVLLVFNSIWSQTSTLREDTNEYFFVLNCEPQQSETFQIHKKKSKTMSGLMKKSG